MKDPLFYTKSDSYGSRLLTDSAQVHIEEKSGESLERKSNKKSASSQNNKVKKRRFKPLKRDELKAKKEETKKRVMTRAKEAIKTIATAPPNNNNHVHVGELEVVAIEAPEDIIDEIYGDPKEVEKKAALGKKEGKPSWFDKERKLSVISPSSHPMHCNDPTHTFSHILVRFPN